MRKQTLIGALGAAALSLAATDAMAAQPYWEVLQNGYDMVGPEQQNGGPGAEQATSVWTYDGDGNVIVTTIYMSSYDVDDYWQCRCSATKLHKDGSAPELVADRVLITDNGGNRPCNHPIADVDEMGYVTWLYGTNEDNGNTETRANVMSATCEEMVEDVQISNNGNNNEGAPHVNYLKAMNGDQYFVGSYLSTGGNDISYARGFHVNYDNGMPVSISEDYLEGIVAPANIGRPATATASAMNRTLFCAAKGDNRPPEDGVQCAWIDSLSGDIIWKEYVAESDPGNSIYMNQPEIAKLSDSKYLVSVTQSSGEGKKSGNQKGASLVRFYLLSATDAGMQIKTTTKGFGKYSTHVGLCGGMYGEDQGEGNNYAHGLLFEASITGNGAPNTVPIQWNPNVNELVELDSWALSPSGDGGYLQNIYGANPNDQGRAHLRCLGDIPNPAYGVEGALFQDAKTLFAMPHSGRLVGDTKNSMILSLIPGLTDAPIEPEEPEPEPTTGSSGATGGGTGGAGGSSSGGPNAPGAPNLGDAEASGGCSMSPDQHGNLGTLIAIAGLGLIAASRRRREEV